MFKVWSGDASDSQEVETPHNTLGPTQVRDRWCMIPPTLCLFLCLSSFFCVYLGKMPKRIVFLDKLKLGVDYKIINMGRGVSCQ